MNFPKRLFGRTKVLGLHFFDEFRVEVFTRRSDVAGEVVGLGAASTSVPKRLWSLPPMPIVTTSVEDPSALNCGGWSGYCATVKFSVFAPPQLTSVSVRFSAAATRCG